MPYGDRIYLEILVFFRFFIRGILFELKEILMIIVLKYSRSMKIHINRRLLPSINLLIIEYIALILIHI